MGFAREVELAPSSAPLVACRDYFGYIPAVYRAQSLVPRLLEAEIGLQQAIVYRKSALSHRQKERLLLALASAEGNADGATTHYEILRLFGESEAQLDQILSDYRHCGLAPAEVALLSFALKLCVSGPSVSSGDIDHLKGHGWTGEVILEAVLIVAWYRCLRCISAGLGTSPDFPSVSILHRRSITQDEPATEPKLGVGPYLPAPSVVGDRFPSSPEAESLMAGARAPAFLGPRGGGK